MFDESVKKDPAKPKKKRSEQHVAISNNGKILALFAIACTAVVGLVSEFTKDRIKLQEQQQLLNTLHSIIEPSRYNNDIANDCINMSSALLGDNDIETGYVARKDDEVVAIALTATAPDGYNGDIDLIVAINMDSSVSGVRVLKHQETPGLGDKIEIRKNSWITSFTNKRLLSEEDSRWAVIKDGGMFDQFTGATITPRAVVKAVKKAVQYFNHNKDSLLTRPNACAIEEEDAVSLTENEDDSPSSEKAEQTAKQATSATGANND